MGHVAPYIGGVYETDKTFDQEGAVYEAVEANRQREAMEFLSEHAFSDPTWAMNDEILSRINQSEFIDGFRGRQVSVLNSVLDPSRIARLIEYDIRGEDTYSPFEFLDDLRGNIWSELRDNSTISVYRRNLQRAYIERMEYLMTEELPDISAQFRQFLGMTSVNVSQSDIRPMVREQLETLQSDISRAKNSAGDRATRVHLADAERRVENILNPDN
jgi:hypothetical protein